MPGSVLCPVRRCRLVLGLVSALVVAACGRAAQPPGESASAPQDFYRGKTVRIVVGSGAGGGFDRTARLVARHISRHIPGSPTVIVENMPGGGGLVAANHLFYAAPSDGLVMGIFPEPQVLNQLTGAEGVQFDLRKFKWLGSSYDDPHVCIVRRDAPVTSFKDMIGSTTPTLIGATGPGSNSYDAPRVIAAATGATLKVVAGYPTTNDVRVGVERGELHGVCLGWESVKSTAGQWLDSGYARAFVQTGSTAHKDLPDVPLAVDFAKDEESRVLLRLVNAPGAISKPFVFPPAVSDDRVEIMRGALMAAYRDPELVAEAKTLRLDLQPKPAAEVQQILDEVLATSPETASKYKKIMGP
jgi:tripartite-type tricarboxylate transporter receptor subunit TctC